MAAGARRAVPVRSTLVRFTVAMLLLMSAIAAAALVGTAQASRVTEQITLSVSPAGDANRRVRSVMVGAQSALRGYLIARRDAAATASPVTEAVTESILEPYTQAVEVIPRELDALDHFLDPGLDDQVAGGLPEREYAAAQRDAVQSWLTWAAAAKRPLPPSKDGASTLRDARLDAEGSRLMDVVLAANADLQVDLDATRAGLRQESRDSLRRTLLYVAVTSTIALVIAVLAAAHTTRRLTTPLRDLRDTVRRQRHGERSAWARTDVGAAEVQDLAEDVNALTRRQLRLLDDHAASLALLRAGNDVVREVQESGDMGEALGRAAREVGRILSVGHVTALVLGEGHVRAAVRLDEGELSDVAVPAEAADIVQDAAAGLWDGPGRLDVPDVQEAGLVAHPWGRGLSDLDQSLSLVTVPIGEGRHASGLLTAHALDRRRVWSEPEIAFMQRVAREVARYAHGHPEAVRAAEAPSDR